MSYYYSEFIHNFPKSDHGSSVTCSAVLGENEAVCLSINSFIASV